MKTITQLYQDYKLMSNLREHMLRVTAVAVQVCDNMNLEVDKDLVIKACLLHDIGNIIKFELGYFPEFLEPEGLEYWQKIQSDYIAKYGDHEDVATYAIVANELNLPEVSHVIEHSFGFAKSCQNLAQGTWVNKICQYADLRVGPHGILSLEQRLEDGKKRYANHKSKVPEGTVPEIVACLINLEENIFENCKIKPEDINDESIAPISVSLNDFVIQ